MTPARDDGLWVRSELLPDGSYGIGFSLDADKAWVLDPAQATQYATSVLREVSYALYDAAVARQWREKIGQGDREVALVLQDLRAHRPPSTWPNELTYMAGVNLRQRPFLTACWSGEPVFQLDPGPAREHAVAALEVVVTSALDNDYRAVLTETIGVEGWRATTIIDDLFEWR